MRNGPGITVVQRLVRIPTKSRMLLSFSAWYLMLECRLLLKFLTRAFGRVEVDSFNFDTHLLNANSLPFLQT